MAGSKVCLLVALLVYGVVLLEVKQAQACPLYCLDVDYMTCASSGEEKLPPSCNCCLANPKPCTLHLKDGSTVSCT